MDSSSQIIEVDGSIESGGGQVLRTALALAAITGQPCKVFNIRSKKPKPGLATQHLLTAQAIAELCNGRLENDFIGSTQVSFWPENTFKDNVSITIPTAASLVLILQPLVLIAVFSEKPTIINLKGGTTDTFFSPTFDYFRYVFLKTLEKIGVKFEVDILKRGYYPEGKSLVKLKILENNKADQLKSLKITQRGALKKITVFSGASESLKSKNVAERQLQGVREVLGKLNLPLEEKIEYLPTQCPGSQICLVAEFENTVIGSDNLGKLDKRAEDVGKEAAFNLLKEEKSQACLDKYLTDQVLPYLALIKKQGSFTASEITGHSKANIETIQKFVKGKFEIKENLIAWKKS